MIEKKNILVQVEVLAANDTKNGCLLSAKGCIYDSEGESFNVFVPAHIPPQYELDRNVLAVRVAAKIGQLLTEAFRQLPYPAPSCLQEEALPPEQQGQT